MKKGYCEICLVVLFVYLSLKFQIAMARHAHTHHSLNLSDCSRCAPGFGVFRLCNRHRDTQCEACAPGSYSSHSSSRRPCLPCSRCGTGLYIAHACTTFKDTVCDSCHTYRGPHNEDYYQRCIQPLLHDSSRSNDTAESPLTKEGADVFRGVPPYIVIFSGVAIAVLAVALVVTCCVVSSRRHCKRVDHRYEAVATQEAVML